MSQVDIQINCRSGIKTVLQNSQTTFQFGSNLNSTDADILRFTQIQIIVTKQEMVLLTRGS